MAQNITLLGADYPAVPAVELPKTGGGTATFTDVTDTTAAAADVASGKYFYTSAGVKTEGTASGGGGGAVTVVDTPDSHGGTIREITAIVVSGSVTINQSGTTDVTNYASAVVPAGSATPPTTISGSGATLSTGTNTITLQKTLSVTPQVSAGYVSSGTAGNALVSLNANVPTKAAATITPGTTDQTIASGTYLTGAQTISGDANLVAANIANGITIFGVTGTHQGGGSAKNVQVEHGTKRVAATAYTDVGYEITVAKTGTYNAYWAGWRSSTSGTNGAQLYVNGEASGNAVTSFDATWTNVQNGSRTSVSLTQGDKVTLRARSRGTSYYMYIFFLSIEEV